MTNRSGAIPATRARSPIAPRVFRVWLIGSVRLPAAAASTTLCLRQQCCWSRSLMSLKDVESGEVAAPVVKQRQIDQNVKIGEHGHDPFPVTARSRPTGIRAERARGGGGTLFFLHSRFCFRASLGRALLLCGVHVAGLPQQTHVQREFRLSVEPAFRLIRPSCRPLGRTSPSL